ncbi:hypothetical protein HDV05_004996 [Chytridiales sp. JEL 0842]|nr:hypothetical protein HDV05_004996 [Chytridiales sp. JEL 0842]
MGVGAWTLFFATAISSKLMGQQAGMKAAADDSGTEGLVGDQSNQNGHTGAQEIGRVGTLGADGPTPTSPNANDATPSTSVSAPPSAARKRKKAADTEFATPEPVKKPRKAAVVATEGVDTPSEPPKKRGGRAKKTQDDDNDSAASTNGVSGIESTSAQQLASEDTGASTPAGAFGQRNPDSSATSTPAPSAKKRGRPRKQTGEVTSAANSSLNGSQTAAATPADKPAQRARARKNQQDEVAPGKESEQSTASSSQNPKTTETTNLPENPTEPPLAIDQPAEAQIPTTTPAKPTAKRGRPKKQTTTTSTKDQDTNTPSAAPKSTRKAKLKKQDAVPLDTSNQDEDIDVDKSTVVPHETPKAASQTTKRAKSSARKLNQQDDGPVETAKPDQEAEVDDAMDISPVVPKAGTSRTRTTKKNASAPMAKKGAKKSSSSSKNSKKRSKRRAASDEDDEDDFASSPEDYEPPDDSEDDFQLDDDDQEESDFEEGSADPSSASASGEEDEEDDGTKHLAKISKTLRPTLKRSIKRYRRLLPPGGKGSRADESGLEQGTEEAAAGEEGEKRPSEDYEAFLQKLKSLLEKYLLHATSESESEEKDYVFHTKQMGGRLACPIPGCPKDFSHPFGLKYHMQNFTHDIFGLFKWFSTKEQGLEEPSEPAAGVENTAAASTASGERPAAEGSVEDVAANTEMNDDNNNGSIEEPEELAVKIPLDWLASFLLVPEDNLPIAIIGYRTEILSSDGTMPTAPKTTATKGRPPKSGGTPKASSTKKKPAVPNSLGGNVGFRFGISDSITAEVHQTLGGGKLLLALEVESLPAEGVDVLVGKKEVKVGEISVSLRKKVVRKPSTTPAKNNKDPAFYGVRKTKKQNQLAWTYSEKPLPNHIKAANVPEYIKNDDPTVLYESARPRSSDFSLVVDETFIAPHLPVRTSVSILTGPKSNTEQSNLPIFTSTEIAPRYKRARMLINTGGSVWGLDWAHGINAGMQYIAVGGYKGNSEEHMTVGYRQSTDLRNCIQIWSCGSVLSNLGEPPKKKREDSDGDVEMGDVDEDDVEEPRLELCILHEWGNCVDLKWAPYGGYESESYFLDKRSKGETHEDDLPRLGFLGISFGDGSMKVLNVPHPKALRKALGFTELGKPMFVRCDTLLMNAKLDNGLLWRLSWGGIDKIVTGMSDGSMALWSVKNALKDFIKARTGKGKAPADGTLKSPEPLYVIPLSDTAISCVDYVSEFQRQFKEEELDNDEEDGVNRTFPPKSSHLVYCCGYDGRVIIVDDRDPHVKMQLYRARAFINAVAAAPHQDGVYFTDSDSTVRFSRPGTEEGLTASAVAATEKEGGEEGSLYLAQRAIAIVGHFATVWSISSTPYMPFVLTAGSDGSVKLSNNLRINLRQLKPEQYTLYRLEQVNEGEFRFVEEVATEPVMKFITHDNATRYFAHDVAIQRAVFNKFKPRLVATGGAAGLVRVESVI